MVNKNNNSNSNSNNNNNKCQVCYSKNKSSKARCTRTNKPCTAKTCNTCQKSIMNTNPSCPTCRNNMRSPRQILANQIRVAARRARRTAAQTQRPNFMEPSPLMNRMVARRGARTGSMSPPPRLQIPQSNSNSNSNNNNTPARARRSRAPSPESNNNMPSLHTGGLVRKTAPHRLLKNEIVLSRAQRKGFTHGQIVKILKSYRS